MAKKTLPLTRGQKAAATKRANGLDLSAIAAKALATRKRNIRIAKREARAIEKALAAKAQVRAQAKAERLAA